MKHGFVRPIGFLSLVFLTRFSFAQIAPSDGCGSNDLPVNSSCVANNYTLPGTFADGGLVNASCAGGNDRDDGWYTFVATGTTTTVELTGDRAKTLAVFSGCPPSTELGCSNVAAGATATVTIPTVVGNTYYVQVHRRGGTNAASMTGTICVYTPPVSSVANDDPCSATAVTVGSSCSFTSYSNAGATATAGAPAPGCANYSGGDVWFTVTVPASGSLVFDSNTGVITDGGMAIYSGTCGALSLISCNDDGSANGLMPMINAAGLTPGATIWIRFWEYGNDNNGTFSLCVYDPLLPCTTPANDDPCSATAVAVGTSCTYTTYTNDCATATAGAPAPGCASYSGGDVWFQVTVPASGQLVFDTNTGVMTDGGMAIYSGTCGALTLIACNDDGSANGLMPMISSTSLTPGATIWIRVWEYGNDNNGTFDLCVTEPPPAPTNTSCQTMQPICSDTPITFTAATGGSPASTVNPGNNYGCLFTSPNPTWFYLELLNDGTVSIDMTAGSDIDFALWGPYPDLASAQADCNSYPAPIDCSYSTSATEQANVPSALAGEVYVLLVTNYANVTQVIDLNSAAGNTAMTDCSIVLPVELTSIYVTAEPTANTIHWTTESELSNDFFVVQRSTDGIHFTSIAEVDGAGNSSAENNYQYADRDFSDKLTYYRLKQVDFDGTEDFSNIVSVNRDNETVLIYPNPSADGITIEFPKNHYGDFIIQYRNMMGSVVNEKATIADNTPYTSGVFSTLPQGIYSVEIFNENGTLISVQKVIKTK